MLLLNQKVRPLSIQTKAGPRQMYHIVKRCNGKRATVFRTKAYQYSYDYITRSELKSLAHNRKIRISCKDGELYLMVFHEKWNVSDEVWDHMTDILNELDVTEIMRKEMGNLITYQSSNPAMLKLGVRNVHHEAFEDWIDHA